MHIPRTYRAWRHPLIGLGIASVEAFRLGNQSMSTNNTTGVQRDSTRFVALFQKAHSHIAQLRRVDDQIAALFEQRRKSLEDLRAVQAQINQEFDRVLELERIIPADMLSGAESKAHAQPKDTYDVRHDAKPETRVSRLESATMS
jgi:hypothetical protein